MCSPAQAGSLQEHHSYAVARSGACNRAHAPRHVQTRSTGEAAAGGADKCSDHTMRPMQRMRARTLHSLVAESVWHLPVSGFLQNGALEGQTKSSYKHLPSVPHMPGLTLHGGGVLSSSSQLFSFSASSISTSDCVRKRNSSAIWCRAAASCNAAARTCVARLAEQNGTLAPAMVCNLSVQVTSMLHCRLWPDAAGARTASFRHAIAGHAEVVGTLLLQAQKIRQA